MAKRKKKLSEAKSRPKSGAKKKLPEKRITRPSGKEKKLPVKKKYPQTKAQKQQTKLSKVSQKIKAQAKPSQPSQLSKLSKPSKLSQPSQPSQPSKNFERTQAFKEFEKKILKSTSPKNQQKAREFLAQQYNVKGKPIDKVIKKAIKKFSQSDFDKTKTYKSFNKKFLRKSDADYKEAIREFWQQQYKKGVSLKEIRKQTINRFVYDTRNRFYKSKKPYWGKTQLQKNAKGEWTGGKPKKRYMWRDRLKGNWIKHRSVFKALLKALEPFHVRNYMQKHKIKDYQKARKKYLKEIKNKALGEIIQLYGIYLH